MSYFNKKDKSKDKARERSTADMTPTDAITAGIEGNSRDPNAETRPQRVPMGQGRNLDTGNIIMDENYYYHWFADMPDKPGKIDSAKAAYYENVTDDDGKDVTRPAGGGTFYLMRIPMKYRNEDLALKKKKVNATMDQESRLGPNEYAPNPNTLEGEGGQSAVRRDSSDNPYS